MRIGVADALSKTSRLFPNATAQNRRSRTQAQTWTASARPSETRPKRIAPTIFQMQKLRGPTRTLTVWYADRYLSTLGIPCWAKDKLRISSVKRSPLEDVFPCIRPRFCFGNFMRLGKPLLASATQLRTELSQITGQQRRSPAFRPGPGDRKG